MESLSYNREYALQPLALDNTASPLGIYRSESRKSMRNPLYTMFRIQHIGEIVNKNLLTILSRSTAWIYQAD